MKGMKEGEVKAWQKGQLGCLVWCDKRPVLMLSTHHRVDHMTTFEQDRGPNHPSTATKPQIALDYNVHKCHVDTVDQLRQYYAMQRKSYKNWPSLAWWLLDVCIINAYTLWCLDTHSRVTQREFRETLLHQLVDAYPIPPPREHVGRPRHRPIVNDGHWPMHSSEKRDCAHCSHTQPNRVKSRTMCKQCGVHLCIDPCFEEYHAGVQ